MATTFAVSYTSSLVFPKRPENCRDMLIDYLKSNKRALCVNEIDMLGYWAMLEAHDAAEEGQIKDLDMHPRLRHNSWERYFAFPGNETILEK